jgi:hypothetical protein
MLDTRESYAPYGGRNRVRFVVSEGDLNTDNPRVGQ